MNLNHMIKEQQRSYAAVLWIDPQFCERLKLSRWPVTLPAEVGTTIPGIIGGGKIQSETVLKAPTLGLKKQQLSHSNFDVNLH